MGEGKRRREKQGVADGVPHAFVEGWTAYARGDYATAEVLARQMHFVNAKRNTPNAAVWGLLGQSLLERARNGEKSFLSPATEWLSASYCVNPDPMIGLQLADGYAKQGAFAAAREVVAAIAQRTGDERELDHVARVMLAGIEAQAFGTDAEPAMQALAVADIRHAYPKMLRGFARLWLRDWSGGWEDHAERFQVPGHRLWNGWSQEQVPYVQPDDAQARGRLNDMTVCLWREQGNGDLVFLLRWLSALRATHPTARIVLKGDPSHLSLANAILEVWGEPLLDPLDDDAVPDYQLSVYDLPYVTGIGAPPDKPAAPEFRTYGAGKVAVKLTGLASNFNDFDRSCRDEDARRWVFTHAAPIDLDTLPIAGRWSWRDTVQHLTGCAALVTVDTAVANIGAAIGLRTHLIPPCLPEYRWGADEHTVDWAPSVRLYRRKTVDDWLPTLARAFGDL